MFTRQEKFVLFALAAIQFNHIVDFMIVMPLGPQLMRTFDMSSTEFSLIMSAYTFSAGICGFFGAFFLDRFDRRTSLIVLNTGFTVFTLACAWAPDYYWLLIMRALTGGFGGLLQSTVLTSVGDAIPFQRRGTAMGVVMTSFSVASVAGVPLSLYFANMFSWHAPFVGLGGASALVTLLLIWKFPGMKTHLQNALPDWRAAVRNVYSLIAVDHTRNTLVVMFLLVFGQFCTITFLSPSLVFNCGLDEKHLFLIYLFGGLSTIFTSPLVGRLVDRFGAYRIVIPAVWISVVPVLLLTSLGPTPEWLIFTLTTFFFLVSNGRMVPAQSLAAATVPPQRRGSFMSLNSSVMQIAAGMAALVAGLVTVRESSGFLRNYNYVGYISVGASLLGIFVLSIREKRAATKTTPMHY